MSDRSSVRTDHHPHQIDPPSRSRTGTVGTAGRAFTVIVLAVAALDVVAYFAHWISHDAAFLIAIVMSVVGGIYRSVERARSTR